MLARQDRTSVEIQGLAGVVGRDNYLKGPTPRVTPIESKQNQMRTTHPLVYLSTGYEPGSRPSKYTLTTMGLSTGHTPRQDAKMRSHLLYHKLDLIINHPASNLLPPATCHYPFTCLIGPIWQTNFGELAPGPKKPENILKILNHTSPKGLGDICPKGLRLRPKLTLLRRLRLISPRRPGAEY